MAKTVLVFAEIREGTIRNVSLECLSVASKITGAENIHAVLFGSGQTQHAETLASYGAGTVHILENERLNPYTNEAFSQAFNEIARELNPDVILLGHSAIGRDFIPRVAAKLGMGMVSDAVDVSVEGDEIVFTRPIYAGKAYVKKKITEGTIIATLRPNNFAVAKPDPAAKVNIVVKAVEIKDLRTIVKEVVQKASRGMDLTEAKIIVSGGRGVRSAEGFKPLNELAEVLRGAVGASRGACDQLYCDYSMQIGYTGKVVTPDLYIACGISGAIQHLAGMSNSKVIVAINTDPEAPIFKVADYGIVGDLFEVVPMLTEEFRSLFKETAKA